MTATATTRSVNHIGKQIGPFMYSPEAPFERRTVQGRTFIVSVAAAYNAMGLIGPEHNGVFILDDTGKSVVMDRHCEESSGYFGPSKRQIAEHARIMALPDADFMTFMKSNPRYRGCLD